MLHKIDTQASDGSEVIECSSGFLDLVGCEPMNDGTSGTGG